MKRWGFLLAAVFVLFVPRVAFAQATFPPSTVPPTTPVPTFTPVPTTAPQGTGTLPNNGSPAQALGFAGTTAIEVGAGLMMFSAAHRHRRRKARDNARPPSAPEQLLPIPRVVVERPRVYAVTPVIAQLYKGPAPQAPPTARPSTRTHPTRDPRAPRDWRRTRAI